MPVSTSAVVNRGVANTYSSASATQATQVRMIAAVRAATSTTVARLGLGYFITLSTRQGIGRQVYAAGLTVLQGQLATLDTQYVLGKILSAFQSQGASKTIAVSKIIIPVAHSEWGGAWGAIPWGGEGQPTLTTITRGMATGLSSSQPQVATVSRPALLLRALATALQDSTATLQAEALIRIYLQTVQTVATAIPSLRRRVSFVRRSQSSSTASVSRRMGSSLSYRQAQAASLIASRVRVFVMRVATIAHVNANAFKSPSKIGEPSTMTAAEADPPEMESVR